MYNDILIATNGGVASARAVEHAVDLAAERDATLHALFVVDEDAYSAYSGDEYVDGHEGPEYGLREHGERALADVERRCLDAGLTVETHLVRGVPHQTVVDVADELGVDLMVAGSKRRPDAYRALLGSVTERVVRLADRPVLVVKTPVDEAGERVVP
ncbi:universal stress protein [Candidatus Halobonum tyrrellensis]|uniref:Universal stress protein UspA-like protein n=1 Tax=Candidatus Halobonum tyrrellensis G22 TaxID=1324957 RepID=V4GYD7_9EURY|nr:universal stress protein [Candidatus Halobonum tyrrellensis]ESP90201.1 universal stress protein UspA-like protein [Candidatus Halobonum tyrrellensis G22]